MNDDCDDDWDNPDLDPNYATTARNFWACLTAEHHTANEQQP